MKRKFVKLLLVILLVCVTTSAVFAKEYNLSSALSVIISNSTLKKCTCINTAAEFSPSDFDGVLGKGDYLTVLSLPDESEGRLLLASTPIKKGQTVSRKSTKYLVFEPHKDKTGTSTFLISDGPDSTKRALCTVFVLERENFAPTAEKSDFDTIKNISYSGFLSGKDPENDSVEFVIVSSPKHGTLKLCDNKTGNFTYTPKLDFTGRDSFYFKLYDQYGNAGEKMRVIIHVSENLSDTVFSDMTNHWAHESAIKVFDDKVLSATICEDGLSFLPDKEVSRGDFLAVCMIGAGLEKQVKRCTITSFSDDKNIPLNIKSYAMTAKELGIIKGIPAKSGTLFESEKPITRNEAEIILSRIIAHVDSSDKALTPYDVGILVGFGGENKLSDSVVTKAQLAKIYCNLKEYSSRLS